MRHKSIKRLFNPRAIAVVGASNTADSVGRIIFETLLRSDCPVYPVHPIDHLILGHPSYHKVEDLPKNVDLAVVATSAEQSVDIAQACGKKKIPFILIVAGGFGETGQEGQILETRLKEMVQHYDSRILGPNTLGIFAPKERIDTIFVEHGDRALGPGGGVAFITQSGSVGVEALGIESNIGFGLRAFVGLGNKIDLNEIDFCNFFRDDEHTTCLALYIESLDKGRTFLETARATSRRKPVVVLKAGRTPGGISAVGFHTGRIAGIDGVTSSAFRQFGIQRVYNEEQLVDAARVLSVVKPPPGNRVAVVSPAGGYSVMSTDEIETHDTYVLLKMAQVSQQTEAKIRSVAPHYASFRNPVDLTSAATDDMTLAALEAVLNDDGVDIVLCITLFAPQGISDHLIRSIASLIHVNTKPVIVVTQFGPFTDGYIRRFYDHGVIGYPSVARGVRAVRWLVERAQIVSRFKQTE